jgi:hypothetical protein
MTDTGSELQATSDRLDSIRTKTLDLTSSVTAFSKVMTQAFATSIVGGKQFEDVLKSLALKMSDLALKAAFKPIETRSPPARYIRRCPACSAAARTTRRARRAPLPAAASSRSRPAG